MIYTGCLYYVLRVDLVVISLRSSLIGSFSVVDISHGLVYVVYNINLAPGVKVHLHAEDEGRHRQRQC